MTGKLSDKFKGCLVGGAAGDALGYAVEFEEDDYIFEKYGEHGITAYELVDGKALISDDTQMTLFTANGLLTAKHAGSSEAKDYLSHIYHSYREWAAMQVEGYPLSRFDSQAKLSAIPELYVPREPGRTCLSCLVHGDRGSVADPVNDSKGCGGVMRVAPIGLFFSGRSDPAFVAKLGAEAAALTHGHELGYIPAAMQTCMIHKIVYRQEISLTDAVRESLDLCKQLYPDAEHMGELELLIEKAIFLSGKKANDSEAIRELGKGWVAEETLAIAVYCALKYETDFENAIIAAVNHGGDSDSTGAVTGNILGAHLGYSAIPKKFTEALELKDLILEIAEKLLPT